MFESALTVLSNLPSLAVDLLAVVLAISRRNRHPVVSMLVVVGIALHFMVRGLYWLGPTLLHQVALGTDYRLVFAGGGLVSAVASGLILAAVFAERPDVSGPPRPQW